MFVWNKNMYMDEKVSKNPSKYRRMIEKKRAVRSCCCITLPANPNNIMDIYSSRELWFKYRANSGLEIIGMASDRENAKELAAQIAEDVYKRHGDISPEMVREFFNL